MLGPKTLQRDGLDKALDILLAALITTDAPYRGIWFNLNKDKNTPVCCPRPGPAGNIQSSSTPPFGSHVLRQTLGFEFPFVIFGAPVADSG